eukprot:XP_025015264.1 receptor-like protein 1 [Ricinus communis]
MGGDFRGPSNLRTLYLELINTNGRTTLLQSLGAFPYLKTLSLSDSNFSGEILAEGFPIFRNLQHLYLNASILNNSFLQSIGKMISLKTISLSSCRLTGTIPLIQGLCELKHLQELDISFNSFTGNLPWCLANLTSLQRLDLSFNHFNGSISLSPVSSLISIYHLDLQQNKFQIPISLNPFANLSKLTYFDCSGNELFAETEVEDMTPKFQLKTLYLSGHGYGGAFPKFLYHQQELKKVDLSNIILKERFPYWLLDNNTNLETLYLGNNSLSGPIQLPVHSHRNLFRLNISYNSFQGGIPMQIGAYFPRLIDLRMSRNGFSHSIPSSFGNMSSLEGLDLFNNQLSGSIPSSFGSMRSLYDLDLSNNQFSGSIPSSFGNMSLLTYLDLSNNHFSGSIPSSFENMRSLKYLHLSYNRLCGQVLSEVATLKWLKWLDLNGNLISGTIPASLSNFTSLEVLDVSNNNISGKIPNWIGNMSSLIILDLSKNDISGSLPSNFGLSMIAQIYLSRNRIQGSLKNAFFISSYSLTVLDLSHNHMTGSIPSWIGELFQLGYLLLSNNNFEGEIPVQLCNLNHLSVLDLSHNKLSGHIHPCLKCSSNVERKLSYTINIEGHFDLITKSMSLSYTGRIARYISGIDFSCNNFTGIIPLEFGKLSEIKLLNLSYNSLIGSIPTTFSDLSQIESLDLSSNKLQGSIPIELIKLYFLAVFNVSYNNLSGRIPVGVAQFGTFGESSYLGNPFLHGCPLPKDCKAREPPPIVSTTSTHSSESMGLIDMEVFYVSFGVAYMMVLLGIAAVLYINPYWRRIWFYYVQVSMENCYYFIIDNLSKFSF